MSNLLKKNLSIKIVCLVAAALLWIYIAASQNTVAKYPGSIQIKAINVPGNLVAIYDIKTVNIKIMADPSTWSKLSTDSFSAYIDLSGHTEGTYEFNVNVVSSLPGVQIIEKNPNKIIVSLEPVISKEVGINKTTEGAAAEGLVAGNIVLDPEKVVIKGPKSVINGISEVYAIIRLNGESEDFTKNISLVALDEQGEAINNVEIIPPNVSAAVAIVKASNNKTVGVKVKTTGMPKAGYYVANISVAPNTIDITGQASTLTDIAYIETAPIDLTNQDVNIDQDVALNLKTGIALQRGSPSKVHVKITLSKNDTSKEITATIESKNLPANYSVASYDPAQVKVICSGSADIIGSINSGDIILTLDFADKKLTDGARVSFEFSSANFKVPNGVAIVSILPSIINATVVKK